MLKRVSSILGCILLLTSLAIGQVKVTKGGAASYNVNNQPDGSTIKTAPGNQLYVDTTGTWMLPRVSRKVEGGYGPSGLASAGLYNNEDNKNLFVAASYGAIPDGVTDNTSILNTLFSKKGKVLLSDGTYLVSGTLSIGDSITILGSRNTVIRRKAGTLGPLLQLSGSAKNIVLENLTIDNNGSTETVFDENGKAVDGLVIRNCKFLDHDMFNLIVTGNVNNKNILIENCVFDALYKYTQGAEYGAVTIENGYNVIVRNTQFLGTLLKLEVYNNNTSGQWYVYNCKFDSILHTSLFLRPYTGATVKDVYVFNNTFTNGHYDPNPKGPFAIEQGGNPSSTKSYIYNVNIYNNYIKNAGKCLYVADSVYVDGLRFTNNHVDGYDESGGNPGRLGVFIIPKEIGAAKNIVIADNVIENLQYPGVKIGNAYNVTITGNIFKNVGMAAPTKDMSGVHVYNGSKYVRISDNTFIDVGDSSGADQYSTGVYIYENPNIDNIVIENNRFITTGSKKRLKSGVVIARAGGGTDNYPTNIVVRNNDFSGSLQYYYYALVLRGSGSVNQADTWIFSDNVVDTLFKPITTSTTLYEEHMTGLGYSNEGATGPVTVTLYLGHKGQSVKFLKVANQTFRVDFQLSDELLGGNGAGKYVQLDSVGTFIDLRCIGSGKWIIERMSGSISYEP